MRCTDLAVPTGTLLSRTIPAELPPLQMLFAFHSSPSCGSGRALAPHQPLQQSPLGTRGWWSYCHSAFPTAGQLPEECASTWFHPHLPKTNSPQKAPAEQSGPSDLSAEWVADRRRPDHPPSHFSHCCCLATSL